MLLLADAVTAEQAMGTARALTSATPPRECAASAGEVIVCGRREANLYRLPLPDERGEPGTRPPVDEAMRPPAIGRTGIAPQVEFGVKWRKRIR